MVGFIVRNRILAPEGLKSFSGEDFLLSVFMTVT